MLFNQVRKKSTFPFIYLQYLSCTHCVNFMSLRAFPHPVSFINSNSKTELEFKRHSLFNCEWLTTLLCTTTASTLHQMLQHGCGDLLSFKHKHQWGQALMLGDRVQPAICIQIYPKGVQVWALCGPDKFFPTSRCKLFLHMHCFVHRAIVILGPILLKMFV